MTKRILMLALAFTVASGQDIGHICEITQDNVTNVRMNKLVYISEIVTDSLKIAIEGDTEVHTAVFTYAELERATGHHIRTYNSDVYEVKVYNNYKDGIFINISGKISSNYVAIRCTYE